MSLLYTFLCVCLVIALAMLILWWLSLKKKDASIIDMFWGAGFSVISLTCVLVNYSVMNTYLWILAGLPFLWGVRLSLYLVKRNWGKGEDKRYTALRKNVPAEKWGLYTLRIVFCMQGLAMLSVSLPIWFGFGMYQGVGLTAENLGMVAWVTIGGFIWVLGFLFEAIGDAQLTSFLKNRTDKNTVLDIGLWRYTRHPNYFGNASMWWGIGIIACAVPWGWVALVSPMIMTFFLLKVTGVNVLERQMKKRPAYAEYMKNTSMFIPWFPRKSKQK